MLQAAKTNGPPSKKNSITTDEKHFLEHDGPKLSYGPHQVGDGVYLKSCNLLFNTSISSES